MDACGPTKIIFSWEVLEFLKRDAHTFSMTVTDACVYCAVALERITVPPASLTQKQTIQKAINHGFNSAYKQ